MPTHSEQARINGAKSKGPTSIEGKAISSKNAIKHGFAAASNVVLLIEDRPAFEEHVAKTRAAYKPNDYAEETFIDQIAALQWRQSRLVAIETAILDGQIGFQCHNLCTLHPTGEHDDYFHLVKAWQALALPRPKDAEPRDPSAPPVGYDITSLQLVQRYQTALDRQLRNALLNLRQYRKDIAPSVAATAPVAKVEPPPAQPDEPRIPPERMQSLPPPKPPATVKPAPVRVVTPINKR